nr:unnamed protein product [Callosobruchus chinensis]
MNRFIRDFEDQVVATEIVNSMDTLKEQTHIINDLEIFHISGYKTIYNNGTYNKCDGTVVFINESITFSHCFRNIGDVKSIELEVGEKKDFLVTCMYRSPSINDKEFVGNLADYLYSQKHVKKHFITGDINLDILKTNNQCTEDYKTIMSSFGYVSYINKYTRPSTKTCIDHFYVKGDQELSKIHAFVINYKITDHCPILISFSSANRHRNENKTSYLKADVKNHFWHEVFHPQDVNIATSNFVQKLQFFIQKNTQTVRKTRRKDPLKPWITKAILRCINKKNHALWQSVKQICNQSQKTSINKIILEDSKTLTDPIEISNHFNTFFGNIGNLASFADDTVAFYSGKTGIALRSQLNYGLVGWGGVRDCHLSVLEILQKWVIKVIFNKEKLYPTNQLYNESNIFDIRQLYFIKILSLVNKRKIDLHTIAHPQNTRQQQSYVLIPLMKKEIGHKCFKYLTAKFFNYLPSYLRASIHEKTFVTQLKTWIHTKDRQDIRNLYKNDF